MRRSRCHRDQGFSLPELMVSSILLALVVTNSTNIFMRSQGSLRNNGLRDALNARIAEDLEDLRHAAWRFGCEDGTDGGAESGACTGLPQDADKPVRYKSGRSSLSAAAPLIAYQQACTNNTMAALMQAKDSRFESGSQNIPLTGTNANSALATANLSIKRKISLDSADQNKLLISYTTPAASPVAVKLNTTLVPQALGWCP